MSVRQHAKLRRTLPDRVELVAGGDLIEELRAVKDADEVARIRAAAGLADSALTWVLERGVVGRTEREVASALEQRMRELGAESPSFDSIVAHGPHGALPHAQPREVPIAADTLLIVDWGARLDGYCSDCTRTYATGSVGAEERDVYELVQRAQAAALGTVAAGVAARDADAVARNMIDAGGHGERFGHGLGHGVGLEVHEPPRLARTSDAVLAAGNVVSVEPGIYLPGRFGVRIEDLVVVTDDGADVLNGLGKDLVTVA
jgi:Xaa-Pro aminopeptidase